MKKYGSYSFLKKTFSMLLCLIMVLSVVAGTELPELFHLTKKVNVSAAADDPDEYKNETLEYMWDSNGDGKPDTDYLEAARPYYACRNSSFGGVEYRTIFHVYAFEGDTICVGSSVYNSTLDLSHTANKHTGDKDSVDIVMTDLNGNTHTIDIRNSQAGDEDELNTTGYIGNWQTEYAAVSALHKEDGKFFGEYTDGSATYKYIPYTYTVTETGVYTFEFHSYNKSNTVNDEANYRKRSEPFHNPKINYGGEIAALNLTVFDESGTEQHGRTYADFLSLQMHPAATGVVDTYYILTTDSYIYKMKFNNVKPYTYNFFTNNKGIYDSATGEIIYTSVKDINNQNTFDEMGAAYKYPGTKDTEMLKSYYIFLEYPNDQLEGELYEKAVQPDPATNLRFVSTIKDTEGNNIPGAYEGEGGYFSFDVEEATTATLRLEFEGEGNQKYAPVEISGAVTPHSTNYFYWNGKDGNGTVIPSNKYTINDFTFTVTTKAGEIHFPIIDMENAPGGITFTRLSHIYDKNGEQQDTEGSIYELTKNVIYYDETAIYYGEPAASTGHSEANVDVAKNKFNTDDGNGGQYFQYKNMGPGGGEQAARNTQYIKDHPNIRIGDHSHTTNVIEYFDKNGNLITKPTEDQKNMISYLSSLDNPVGKSTTTPSTTDYAIANFWTFIPAKPARASIDIDGITIGPRPEHSFNLTGRVFFDVKKDGIYNDMSADGDYPLKDVTLNLYKKTTSTSYDAKKTYVTYNSDDGTVTLLDSNTFASASNKYELVDTGLTTGEGMYKFTGLEYDPTAGTEYLYQVIKPDERYTLTSQGITAESLTRDSVAYGYYANKSYGTTYKGTEVQRIIVGKQVGQVDPTVMGHDPSVPNTTNAVCAVDVGYNYEIMSQSLVLKKTWDTTETHPTAVAYEVHCNTTGGDKVYAYHVISAITSWQYENEYLSKTFDGSPVEDYYVAAEYYIDGDNIYRHTFAYENGKYGSFVGTTYRAELSELGGTVKNFSNIPDLSVLKNINWGSALAENAALYKAVLDRNISSDRTTITITNAKAPGTIEIFKYQGTNVESNALQGATFRVYDLTGKTVDEMKNLVTEAEKGDQAATKTLKDCQVGSATTRSNGRIAFPGLDPTKSYFIREVFAPAGFRILNPFYVVYAKDSSEEVNAAEGIYKFDTNNYVKVDVGNAPADTNFYILKRIEGRAWQENDRFSFKVLNAYDSSTSTELSTAVGIRVDAAEQAIISNAGETPLVLATAFADEFKENSADKKNIVEVGNSNPYYSYSAKDTHVEGKTNTFTYADRKMSDQLLVDGSEFDRTKTNTYASFCGVTFPMAGVYTFTIYENDITDDDTLIKSDYEYTVILSVTRVPDATGTAVTDLMEDNSHLVAEVSSITYTEDADGVTQIYAGSSPLFTNRYAPAPAKQDTSYKIVKNFTGRKGNEWLSTDEFTITVSGVDTETQDAIKKGNLVINGAGFGDLSKAGAKNEWVHTFTGGSEGHAEWKFDSFTFNGIIFPVQYVKNGEDPTDPNNVWNSTEDYPTPPKEQIGRNPGQYSAQTIPVTYWLKIAETIPAETKGIDYDDTVYYLQIVLRNAEAKVSVGSLEEEEEDGIIDEIDMKLYHVDHSVTDVTKLKEEDCVATCQTRAEVLEFDQWKVPGTPSDGGKYAWFYVDKNNKLIDVTETHETVQPKDAKLLVRRWDKHEDVNGGSHTITITNTYHTSYTWVPKIQKVLAGRNWLATDEFTFTLTADSENEVGGCSFAPGDSKELSITSDDITNDYTKVFDAIKFTKAGTYEFTITEKDEKNNSLATYDVIVEVEDNGDGTLQPTIEGSDSKTIEDEVFQFTNTYESTAFDLDISKQIIGRAWTAEDQFTFKIKPDLKTRDAIDNGTITVPGKLNESDGSYTVKINSVSTTGDIIKQSFGKVEINNIGTLTEGTQYKFTISEVTEDLENMYCREPAIDLFITIQEPEITPGGTETTHKLVATYAHRVSSSAPAEPSEPTDSNVTIPFTNVAIGNLTVAKKVVSSSEADTTEFGFEVVFTYKNDTDQIIKAVKGGTKSIDPKKETNKWTYSFTLKDGEKVEFSDIPADTQYQITETNTDKYMLLYVRDHDSDDGPNLLTSGDPIGDTITSKNAVQYRLFVNGLIKELPTTGGFGINGRLFLGLMLMIAGILAIAMQYLKYRKQLLCKKRLSRDGPDG